LLISANAYGEAMSTTTPACAAQAITQAEKLLAFHFGDDDRISIDPTAKALPSMSNPADASQRLSVVEVWGHIYKGRYRMRFLYAGSGTTACTLMGQEILEQAKF